MKENSFQLAQLRPQLKPFRLYFYPRLRSTNDHAALLRRQRKLYAPAIVLTPHQMKGRGRGSNTWWSGEGSLTVTFCVPTDEKIPPHQVPLITGLAVRDALAELLLVPSPQGERVRVRGNPSAAETQSAPRSSTAPLSSKANLKRPAPPSPQPSPLGERGPEIDALRIKWPNDLWHDDLKIAGLLCERIENVDLLGLGLNVNVLTTDIPTSLRHRVTSLQAIAGRPFLLPAVLVSIARQIEKSLLNKGFGGFNSVVQRINRVHALTGRRVRVTEPGESVIEGLCEGLESDGRLLVRTNADVNGLRRIVAGHVELLL